ncbi:ABC transporter ATP-binding protein [Olsenella phocaeensis]|uniref:ABC transporter ATP-binding protein n=1 Tax=Olsenella phocaeensis TaxID=1852385 RepID=UPI000930F997|nr:ABC transporter ATP-binding protein [Olsenella phocaeensis]
MANPYQAGGSGANLVSSVRGGGASLSPEGAEAASLPMRTVLRRLGRYVAPHAASLVLSFVASLCSVALQLYVPILIGRAIDAMAYGAGVAALVPVLRSLALVVVVAASCQWLSGYFVSRLAFETVRDLRDDAYDHLSDLPLATIDAHPHGDLLARVVADADAVGDGLLQGLNQLMGGVVTIAGTIAFMCSISVPVALVVVLLTPVLALVASLIARRSSSSFASQQGIQGELGGYVEEVMGNQRLFTAFARTGSARERFAGINARLYDSGERAQFVSSLTNPATRVVNNSIYAIVAVVGCLCVVGAGPSLLTVGQVQSFLSYANQYMKPFNEVSAVVGQVQGAFASARRLIELMDSEPQTQDTPGAVELVDPKGALELEDLHFSYEPGHEIIRGFSLSVPAGGRFALVGPTGCGKTTLISLLLRFFDLDSGRILVDGQDVSGLSASSLRAAFGMVLQETWLFEGSVRDNIAYGRPDATDAEVEEAARRAHAHKFVMQLPQGYDTPVGEGGGSLSQGQRQLLCIARVMLADPPVLLLDEATSSIDTRTELQVQDAFDRMMVGRTSLVVAHRLSTVRNADCIVVMDAGKIVEMGTHDELLARGGFYARLYQSQFALS